MMFLELFHAFRRYSRYLGVRVALIGALAIVAVLLSKALSPLIPTGLSEAIGAESVDRLLSIIANSMLAVTTFSLSVMVTVHRSVSSQWTPRAHRMQVRDTRSQTVLATFVGAYVYAILSIVLMEMSFFAPNDIVVLFAMTTLIIAMVAATMLRWVLYLQSFGSLGQTSKVIEDETRLALAAVRSDPCFGAKKLEQKSIISDSSTPIFATSSGYIQRVAVGAVNERCGDTGTVWFVVRPGDFVHMGDPLAYVEGDTDLEQFVAQSVLIKQWRDIPQDPAFGLQMLAEIAVKALSPGINDGGTAIDMINRIADIVDGVDDPRPPRYQAVYLPPMDPAALLAPLDLISRHGANNFEVSTNLLFQLKHLFLMGEKSRRQAVQDVAQACWARSKESLPTEVDRLAFRKPDWI